MANLKCWYTTELESTVQHVQAEEDPMSFNESSAELLKCRFDAKNLSRDLSRWFRDRERELNRLESLVGLILNYSGQTE